MTPDHEALLR
jgi:hypothetical protein